MINLEKAKEYEERGLLKLEYQCGKYYAVCPCGLGWDSIDGALKCCSDYSKPEEEIPPSEVKIVEQQETLQYASSLIGMPKVALIAKSQSNATKWRQLFGFREEDVILVTENNLEVAQEYPLVFVGHISKLEKLSVLEDPFIREEFERQKHRLNNPSFNLKKDKEGYFLEETQEGDFSKRIYRNGRHLIYSEDSELF